MLGITEEFQVGQVSKHFFLHNLKVNGPKALIYCFGLSASRYIEYSAALIFVLRATQHRRTVLEVGCGHSILATYWTRYGFDTTVVDIADNALKWQIRKGKSFSKSGMAAVQADARFLPFKNGSFDAASCISSIEHVPHDGDAKAASEVSRVLSNGGVCIISLSTPEVRNEASTDDWATGIPAPLRRLFGSSLPAIMSKVGVDRKHQYFERYYSDQDITERIIRPSNCKAEDRLFLRSKFLMRFLHRKLIPTGALTLLEYMLVRFFSLGRKLDHPDAVILKLAKPN